MIRGTSLFLTSFLTLFLGYLVTVLGLSTSCYSFIQSGTHGVNDSRKFMVEPDTMTLFLSSFVPVHWSELPTSRLHHTNAYIVTCERDVQTLGTD
jgi:hypothetical protein